MAEMLEGKVVLITGATGRIGLGMAQAFHAAGAIVALGDLHQDTVERVAADLGGSGPLPESLTCGTQLRFGIFSRRRSRLSARSILLLPMPASFQPSRFSTWRSRNGTA